jgi:hypothetical protein
LAAIAVAFYPSLVLWSAQGLKDGPTVFLLSLAILATLKLGEKLTLKYILILLGSLIGLFALRFYVLYMISVAIGGAFVIGMQQISATSFARQFSAVICRRDSLGWHSIRTLRKPAISSTDSSGSLALRIRFWAGCRCFQHFGRYLYNSDGHDLLTFCSVPLANNFVAAKHYIAGDGYLVGLISVPGVGTMVFGQISIANDFADIDLHCDAYFCLFGLSRQRRHCLPSTRAVAGVLLYLRGGGLRPDERKARGKEAAGIGTTTRNSDPTGGNLQGASGKPGRLIAAEKFHVRNRRHRW